MRLSQGNAPVKTGAPTEGCARTSWILRLRFELFGGVSHQCNLTRTFDGNRHLTLVTGTVSGNAARKNLPSIGQILGQPSDILIVSGLNLVDAELTHLATFSASSFTWHIGSPLTADLQA